MKCLRHVHVAVIESQSDAHMKYQGLLHIAVVDRAAIARYIESYVEVSSLQDPDCHPFNVLPKFKTYNAIPLLEAIR